MPSRPSDERGSASVAAAAMMAVLLAVTFGAVQVGSAVIARHRAQAAADMAALAAASLMPAGPQAACDKATAVARAMGTAVSFCTAETLDVTVIVDAQLPWAPSNIGPARAVAPGRTCQFLERSLINYGFRRQ